MIHRLLQACCLLWFASLCISGCRADDDHGSVRQAPAEVDSEGPDTAVGTVHATWLQDQGDGTDTLARGTSLVVMAWDSDSRTERPLVSAPGSYAKPLVLWGGQGFLFSDRRTQVVWRSDGPGSAPRALGPGVALGTWRDGAGVDWVIVGLDPTADDPGEYRRLARFPIDRPDLRQPLPLAGIVNEDNFQISADGRLAGGVFPWPHVGWFDMRSGTAERTAEGCWAGLAPLDPPLLAFLDGAHRRMTLVSRADPARRWQFTFDAIPALRGHEIYHPRWTSHARALMVTGPYIARTGGSAVRSGGTQVEVFLVILNRDLTGIERWHRVSHNDRADFYPDAWMETGGEVAARPGGSATSTPASDAGSGRAIIEARLVSIAETPTLRAIAPYTQALVAGHYEVTKVIEGSLVHSHVAIAHWVIRDGRPVPDASRVPGRTFRLSVEPYADHTELEGERLVMAGDAAELPLYYEGPLP
jgi:hypothetical protein